MIVWPQWRQWIKNQKVNENERGCDKMSNHFVHSLFFYAHLGSKQAITEKRAYDPFPHKNCFSTVYAAFFKRSLLLWYL